MANSISSSRDSNRCPAFRSEFCVVEGRSLEKGAASHVPFSINIAFAFGKSSYSSRTAKLDPTYEGIVEYAQKHLKQDNRESQFSFTDFASDELTKIVEDWSSIVAREKRQRKEDNSKAPLSSMLISVDDMSDSPSLRLGGGVDSLKTLL